MSIFLVILAVIIAMWVSNAIIQHKNGNRIAFHGISYAQNTDGSFFNTSIGVDVIADVKNSNLIIGESLYTGSYSEFANGERKFTSSDGYIDARIGLDKIIYRTSDGRVVKIST